MITVSTSQDEMVCSKVLKKWQLPVLTPKREVRLWSPARLVYPPNGTCGSLITGTLCRRHGLFMSCLTFDFRTQDGWRIDWQRLRKQGNSVFCLFFFLSRSPFSSRVSHHPKKDAFWESLISDHIHYAISSAGHRPSWMEGNLMLNNPDPVLRAMVCADVEQVR